MSRSQRSIHNHRTDFIRQRQQTQTVGDSRAGSSDALRRRILRHTEVVDQRSEALRLFNRVQILALEVFDHRQLHHGLIVRLNHHRRNGLQSGAACGTPAALPCDNLIVSVFRGTHRDRRQNTVQTDAVLQLLQGLFFKDTARLCAVRLNFYKWNGLKAVARLDLSYGWLCHSIISK